MKEEYTRFPLQGDRFGRLVLVLRVADEPRRQQRWLCRCDCGQEKEVRLGHLRAGVIRSCGCLEEEARFWARPPRSCGPKHYPKRAAIRIHRMRAERALGRPLPKGAEVHHLDETREPDAPLVICQSRAYHMLLHRRARILRAGGTVE